MAEVDGGGRRVGVGERREGGRGNACTHGEVEVRTQSLTAESKSDQQLI